MINYPKDIAVIATTQLELHLHLLLGSRLFEARLKGQRYQFFNAAFFINVFAAVGGAPAHGHGSVQHPCSTRGLEKRSAASCLLYDWCLLRKCLCTCTTLSLLERSARLAFTGDDPSAQSYEHKRIAMVPPITNGACMVPHAGDAPGVNAMGTALGVVSSYSSFFVDYSPLFNDAIGFLTETLGLGWVVHFPPFF